MQNLSIPTTIDDIDPRHWETFSPYFEALAQAEIAQGERRIWLENWSHLLALLHESSSWIYIQTSRDTTDKEWEQTFLTFLENVAPRAEVADQALKERLLALDFSDMPDMSLVLRSLRN